MSNNAFIYIEDVHLLLNIIIVIVIVAYQNSFTWWLLRIESCGEHHLKCTAPIGFPVRKIPAAGPENGKFRTGKLKTVGHRALQYLVLKRNKRNKFFFLTPLLNPARFADQSDKKQRSLEVWPKLATNKILFYTFSGLLQRMVIRNPHLYAQGF